MKEEKPDPRLAMKFEKFPNRYYQRRRNKHSSGDAEWHSRPSRYRRLQHAITESVGVVTEGQWGDLALRIALALTEEER
jgi:hypothetical protein